MSEEEGSGSFKVNDKRRFDSTGNERGDTEPPKKEATVVAAPTSEARVAENRVVENKAAPDDGDEPEINFSSFVVSLATQALMQLGEMEPPPGVQLPKDIVGAKQTIDILGLLEGKTKGNLDASEERLLKEILHNLRLSFVRHSTEVK